MTPDIDGRVRPQSLLDKVVSVDEVATPIHDGMTIGMGSSTRAGNCETVPFTLARCVAHEPLRITLVTGASLGNDIGKVLVKADVIARRLPPQTDATLRCKINAGEVMLTDQHLLETVEQLRLQQIASLDVVAVEATAITENGGIVSATSADNSASFAVLAEQTIVKINLDMPANLKGLHDILFPVQRPYHQPIPLIATEQCVDLPSILIDLHKTAAIVITGQDDSPSNVLPPDAETNAIVGHPNAFLAHEVRMGRLSPTLQPLQAGTGMIFNVVLYGFIDLLFHDLKMYSEVLQDSSIELLDSGKLVFALTSSITLSRPIYKRFLSESECYKMRMILRPQEINNHPEVICRLGLITTNTALECDIYGSMNSTHMGEIHMMNGIGGSGDFPRNVHLSVFVTRPLAKDGDISSIVPVVSYADHTEHDTDTVVTEHGLADLRGLAPCERAVQIVSNCADPCYHELPRGYVVRTQRRGGHTPHLLEEASARYARFRNQDSMASAGLTGESLLPEPALNA